MLTEARGMLEAKMNKRIMPILAVSLVFGGAGLRADEPPRLQTLVLPGTGYTLASASLDANTLEPRADLVAALETWIAAELHVPAVADQPHFVFASPYQLLVTRYGQAPRDRRGLASSSPLESDVVALYETRTGTVYLPRGWTGETPAELSVLAHELVHHVQSVADIRYACPAAMEASAFDAQDRLLALFGTNLEREFGIDPFTRLARTVCVP